MSNVVLCEVYSKCHVLLFLVHLKQHRLYFLFFCINLMMCFTLLGMSIWMWSVVGKGNIHVFASLSFLLYAHSNIFQHAILQSIFGCLETSWNLLLGFCGKHPISHISWGRQNKCHPNMFLGVPTPWYLANTQAYLPVLPSPKIKLVCNR